MFRVKLSLVAIIFVLIVVVYVITVLPLAENTTKNVNSAIERASRLVSRSQRLNGFELVNLAETIAREKEFVDGVQAADEKQRRVAIFDSITQYDKKLKREGRKAHFFSVVGKDGAIIARDLDINNMYGEKLPYQNVKEALAGRSAKDIWGMKNRMMRAAAAPIWVGSEVKGAVVIAYEVTAAEAREERDQFGTHVAYFMDDAVRASSFSMEADEKTEDSSSVEALTKAVLTSASSLAKASLASNKTSDIFQLELQGETYLAMTGPLPDRLTNPQVGYIVLASLTDAQKDVMRLRWMFVIFGLGMICILLGGTWAVRRHFLNAEDKLELGVTEVINGNLDYTFEGVQEFEGLANAINVMLSRLLGRPEPGEDGEESEAALWRPDVITIEELDMDSAGPDLVRKLAAEPEENYYVRIYREYIDARKQYNLPVEGLTPDNLVQKLKANEAILKAKHECHTIRFLVNSQAGKVSFKPIRIG